MTTKTVSVYGYGRFGKLWADILAEDFQVQVYSRHGVQPEEVSGNIKITDEKGIFDCDALFFCVSISSFEDVLQKSSDFCKEKSVFFDTCSVKVYPVGWMKEHLPACSKIIGTHPMFGPDSYPQTTEKLAMVMSNISADSETFAEWTDYFSTKSLEVEVMSAELHDQMTAYSQGITHYMGRVFADLQLQPSSIDTHGYKKLLEVMARTCNDSWQLFLGLQRYNPYAQKMRRDLQASLEKVNKALDSEEGKG